MSLEYSLFTRRRLMTAALSALCLKAAGKAHARGIWDETWDVVVVGSGFAGLAAAIEAHRHGADVLLIEKMDSPGGNSALSTGDMAVPASPIQFSLGISEDSPERMKKDLLRMGVISDPVRCETVAKNALDTWLWTRDELGVRWVPDALQKDEGMSVPRGCMVRTRSGREMISALMNRIERLEIKTRMHTQLVAVLGSPAGIEGVVVRENFRFGSSLSGSERRIRTRKGVILATGGFGADVAFREQFDPRLNVRFPTDNQPGATSEALRAAMAVGAAVRDLKEIQVLPWVSADEVGIGNAWSFIEHVTVPYGIWVDASGRRFINEEAPAARKSARIVEALAAGSAVYAIVDSQGLMRSGNVGRSLSDWQSLVQRGIVRHYSDLEAMAADLEMSAEVLNETVSRFNGALRSGRTDPFGRRPTADILPLSGPDWYVVEIQPKVHYCMGGLVIGANSEVIGSDGRPIPGFWAAGEVTGGTFGRNRAPCHSSTDALVTGRIAGAQAARSPSH